MNSHILQQQASTMNFPMDDNLLEEKWGQLVNSHFGELKRDMTRMVTTKDMEGNDVVDEALLQELDWAISRKKLEDLLEGYSSYQVHLPVSVELFASLCRLELSSPQRMPLAYIR